MSKIRAHIIEICRVDTGEKRKYIDDRSDTHNVEFHWNEGNYCCDCNRELFFRCYTEDAPEGSPEDVSKVFDEIRCSKNRYTIEIRPVR